MKTIENPIRGVLMPVCVSMQTPDGKQMLFGWLKDWRSSLRADRTTNCEKISGDGTSNRRLFPL